MFISTPSSYKNGNGMANREIELPARKPGFHRDFEGEEDRFVAAYEEGVERLAEAIELALDGEVGQEARLTAGLTAALEFLATDPPLARLLLVEALASRRARLEHERSVERLAVALRPVVAMRAGGGAVPVEVPLLLAGGLASLLSGRVAAGEAERLPEARDPLLDYLLGSSLPATPRFAGERPA